MSTQQTPCARTIVSVDAIPDDLKSMNHWVTWRYETRDGKVTKPPYQAGNKYHAKSNDPRTWATFDAALRDYNGGQKDGIGFVFTDTPLCGTDLDHCIKIDDCISPDGTLTEQAFKIVESLNSYTERTPSGTGLHILVYADFPGAGLKIESGPFAGVEVYGDGSPRYFTVTGDHWPGTPTTIEPRKAEFAALYAGMLASRRDDDKPEKTVPQRATATTIPDDTELLNRARSASNGAKFDALFDRGDWSGYQSQSQADKALCQILAFWTGKDGTRIDRLFRQSALMRDKWDEVHRSRDKATYGQMTIEAAINDATEVYSPAGVEAQRATTIPATSPAATSASTSPSTATGATAAPAVEASEIPQDEPIRARAFWRAVDLMDADFPDPIWIIPSIIPQGYTVLAGRPKVGKSFLALQIACAIGTGGNILGREVGHGKVLYIALEDNPEQIQARMATQAWPRRTTVDFALTWPNMAMDKGIDKLEESITSEGYTLVIIDTLSRLLRCPKNRDDLAEKAVDRLQHLTRISETSIIANDHHRKGSGLNSDVIDDVLGGTYKAGDADTVLGLYRERGSGEAHLIATGRAIAESDIVVKFDHSVCIWKYIGAAGDVITSDVQRLCLNTLITGPLGTTEIAEALNMQKGNVSRECIELAARGFLKQTTDGRRRPWGLTTKGEKALAPDHKTGAIL